MKLSNTMILGLGTGRCGTLHLSDFLKQQPDMALCTHEHLKWKWNKEEQIRICAFNRYSSFENSIVGDVGSFLLPHVGKIAQFFKQTKIIILKRNKENTIASWMRWTNKVHNYWVPHTKGVWEDDLWDVMFPKFDMEDAPKENVIGAYYDYYYEECKKLESDFETLWISTEDLDNDFTRKSICEFCGFNLSLCKLNIECKRNASCGSKEKKHNTNQQNTDKIKSIREQQTKKRIDQIKKILANKSSRSKIERDT